MKSLKKILAVVMVLTMIVALGATAYASGTEGGGTATASITINRDTTWDANAESKEATYTYYKIFDAKDIDQEVTEATGEQANTNGVAVYTVDSVEKANALPAIFKVNNKAPGALTAADAASDGLFYVTLADNSTGAADIAAALKTMVEANNTLFPGTDVTSDANPVVINGLVPGYYLIKASNGSVLAVQTLDTVEINEKNDYPKVDKKQKKEADPSYSEAKIPAEIGTYIDYQITVSIPDNANKDIIVGDKMSSGLAYDETTGLTFSPDISESVADVASTDEGYAADATWQIKIPAATVIANKGNDIVITYRALITEDCLTDTGRENEVTLTYDEGNYVLKDTVEYTTYFGGIEKVDGANSNTKLEGVKFELTVGETPFKVSKDNDGFYYPDPDNGSNEVETDEDGLIIIRGLDNTKTYTLTETETNTGYNLLETPKDLTLAEDTGDAYSTATFDKIENNKGAVLPSTGGIGTTIFYVVGGLMVAGAGVILVTRRRMSAEK